MSANGKKEMHAAKEGTPEPHTNLQVEGRESPSAREFRFVNNSQRTMINPTRTRMKPAFKALGVLSNSHTSLQNRESLIIEQTFDPQSAHFVNSPSDLTSKYVLQVSVKRPPGRPRKHPVGEPKPKRPKGRPRKHPDQYTVSSKYKLAKKPAAAIAAAPVVSSTDADVTTTTTTTTTTTIVSDAASDAIAAASATKKKTTKGKKKATTSSTSTDTVVDTELLNQSIDDTTTTATEPVQAPVAIVAKRGRGRPRKEPLPLPKEDHDVATSVAAAAVAAHLLNNVSEDA